MPAISLIIPCYNESKRIDLLMNGLMEFDSKWNQSYEVIIVNDGSTDNTVDRINEALSPLSVGEGQGVRSNDFSKLKSKIQLISQENTGKGGALKNGIAAAQGDYILTLDADMSAKPTELLEWQKLDKNLFKKNEIFIGNRTDKNSKIEALALRRTSGAIFNFFIKLFTPLNLGDTQCGFKLYPATIAKSIFRKLSTNGWAHDVEVLYKAHLKGIAINEMPLAWKNADDSHVNVFTDSIKMFIQILRISLGIRIEEIFVSPFKKHLEKESFDLSKYYRLAFVCLSVLLIFLLPKLSFDFGITGDEHWHHDYGNAIYNYFVHGDNSILDWKRVEGSKKFEESGIHYYGGLMDMWVATCNHVLGWWGDYEMQHFCIAIVGALGIVGTGLLAGEIGGWLAALIALLILALSPSYLGHCFNNPKDIPFATFSVFAIYQLIRLIKQLPKPHTKTTILLTLSIGAALGVRIGGLLLIIYMWMFILGFLLLKPELRKFITQKLLIRLSIVSVFGYAIGLIFWPFGHHSPIANPLETLKIMSHFFTPLSMIFDGEKIMNNEVPWYYIPRWISITAPIIFLVGLVGFLSILFVARKKYNLFFVILLAFVSVFPWAYAVKKESPLYDGWRHFLFIYPTLVVLAALFWSYLISTLKKGLNVIAAIAVIALLCLPLKFILQNHPNEYLYFNEYFGGIQNAYCNYETDYYMNSSKQAFDWLVANEKLAERKDSFSIRTNCVDPISYYRMKFCNNNLPTHYDLKNGAQPNYGINFPHPNMFVGYANFKSRGSMNDWDYGIFYSRFLEKELLQTPGYFPPVGTIHTIELDGVPLMCIVKRNQKLEKKYLALADTLLKQNKVDSAIVYAQKTLDVYAENSKAIEFLFNAYMQKRDVNSLVAYFQNAIKKYPASDAYYFYLGYAYAMTGNKNNAANILNMAVQLNQQWYQPASQILGQMK
jgi:glycosyltransferase involved in cell wall biosynthesis/tetratricopeptide (TPR) repeat protein